MYERDFLEILLLHPCLTLTNTSDLHAQLILMVIAVSYYVRKSILIIGRK